MVESHGPPPTPHTLENECTPFCWYCCEWGNSSADLVIFHFRTKQKRTSSKLNPSWIWIGTTSWINFYLWNNTQSCPRVPQSPIINYDKSLPHTQPLGTWWSGSLATQLGPTVDISTRLCCMHWNWGSSGWTKLQETKMIMNNWITEWSYWNKFSTQLAESGPS